MPVSVAAAIYIRPALIDNYADMPFWGIIPLTGITSLILSGIWNSREKRLHAFLASSVFIATMLGSTAIGLFPLMLPSSNSINPGISINQAASGGYGLEVALYWWIPAFFLVSGYFFLVHRLFSGKIAD